MSRFLPDTSCLVAAVCGWHEHHAATTAELSRRAKRRESMIMAAPALVESYAVLTRLPPPYRLRPRDALAVMEGSWQRAEVVSVPGPDVWDLLRALPPRDVAGGAAYDAQIAACARQGRAEVILTWNARHFERVAEDIEVAQPSA